MADAPLLPLVLERHHSRAYSWLQLLPSDVLSDLIGLLLKGGRPLWSELRKST